MSAKNARRKSRLQRLIELKHRVEYEIAREVRANPPPRPKVTRRTTATPRNRVDGQLVELGVTSRQVRRWAYEQGLIDTMSRGRISAGLVDEYAEAHKENP